jgi:hypothetical protein
MLMDERLAYFAMHEAEKMLTRDQCGAYIDALVHLDSVWVSEYGACAFATAAQRAEAFLRTLGLWTDTNGA